MSILFISDIHADVKALQALLKLTGSEDFTSHFGKVDTTFCLGDTLERGYRPGDTVELLKTIPNLNIVIGNHDEAVQRGEYIGSGDQHSIIAHSNFMADGGMAFFDMMPKTIVDTKNKIYAAHGGIIDPVTIAPSSGISETDAWLYTETWQRPTDNIAPYFDCCTGYYYTPGMSFDRASEKLSRGFIIATGHQHGEHAYMERRGTVYNLLKNPVGVPVNISGIKLRTKPFALEEKANYHFVVGCASLTDHRNGWGISRFGVLWENHNGRVFSLITCKPLLK